MKMSRFIAASAFCLMTLVALPLTRLTLEAYTRFAATRDGLQSIQIAYHAMVAAEKVSFERGPANGVMGDANPPDAAKRERLGVARQASDKALDALLNAVQSSPNPQDARSLDQIREAREILLAARRQVDSVAQLPRDERKRPEVTGAVEHMFAAIPPLLEAVTLLSGNAETIYPDFREALNSAGLSVELREYAGRLGSQFTSALTTRHPLTDEERANVNLLRGRIEQLRELISTPAHADAHQGPHIRDALDEMDARYFGTGLALVEALERSSDARRDYGLDTAQFAARYVPEMDSIVRVRDALVTASMEGARLAHAKALYELILGATTAAAILITLLVLLFFFRNRIVRPVKRATDALIAIAGGLVETRVPLPERDDEIGRMLSAVEVVRENSVARRKLEGERSRLMDELQASKELYRLVAENTHDVIWLLNLETLRYKFVSPSIKRLRGWTPEELMAMPKGVNFSLEVHEKARSILDDFHRRRAGGDHSPQFINVELDIPHKAGHLVPVEITGTLMLDEAGQPMMLGVSRDISERRSAEKEIRRLAFFDKLTGLPNRRLLEDRLEHSLARAAREHQRMALLFIDLDDFKPINDEFGHEVGDWLLGRVGERMLACVRSSDTAARMGGDEFVVLLEHVEDQAETEWVADKIRRALYEPFVREDGSALRISSSIGVAMFPDHAESARDLLRLGDVAMYRAKRSGRNAVCIFEPFQEGLVHMHWRPAYECGNAMLDDEHREMFRLLNVLIDVASAATSTPDEVGAAFDALVVRVTRHFSHEEEILRAGDFEFVAQHTEKHQQLLDRARALRDQCKASGLSNDELIDFLVSELVVGHLLRHDTSFFGRAQEPSAGA
jgi:diguanylate cyclase (GGDEF)-like protein/hemerythrin-like metal-binding protein/PAS domain S-box-containing protein